MIPLQQFICDTCGGVIETTQDGWFEWLSVREPERYRYQNFRICHHERRCMRYADRIEVNDGHLEDFLSEDGKLHLLSMIDTGPFVNETYEGPTVLDLREFMEVFRRLTIPFYEEARQYFGEAKTDGLLEGCNEVTLYREGMLREIIERYAPVPLT